MTRRITIALFCLLLLVAPSTPLFAQEIAATLTGTVSDSAGGVIQGATITIHSDATNQDVRTVTTDDSGGFTATNLPAGQYSVTVKSTGFQTYIEQHVILNVAAQHNLVVQLKPGQVDQTVQVEAQNTTIQTTTAEQSGTVTGRQVQELALNNRNFEQLVLLQPGVANQLPDQVGFGLQNNTVISINGARSGANNWTVDGADINDSGSNGTLLNVPSIDAIQEFTLARGNYSAQYGRSGGGQVVVATRAGSDRFTGSAYEFNRNNYYNANTVLGKVAGQPTPIERYNDFGFTLGGPLFIPKLYHPQTNKTYFFWSEEWRKASTPNTNVVTVPTAAQLTGVFAPSAFPGFADNKTPAPVAPAGCVSTDASGNYVYNSSCFSQNAKAYIANLYSKNPANANNGTQVITNYSQLNNYRQDIIRLDQNVGDKIHVFARYMEDVVPQNQPFGLWGGSNLPGVEVTSINAPGRNLVGNVTWTITPHVVNEVEYVDAWGAINSTLNGTANSSAFNSQLTGNTAYQDPYGRAPNVSLDGGAIVALANGSAPYFERNIDKNLFDNLSINWGKHTFRMGVTAMWMTKTENASGGTAGFNFTSTNGNPTFANFLLGQADSYSQSDHDVIPHLNYVNLEGYFQDDWKISPRVTLNLGMRYSYFPSPTDSNHTLVNFDPTVFSAANAPKIDPTTGSMVAGQIYTAANYANGLIFPKGATCDAAKSISSTASCSPYGSMVNPGSNNNWGPRIGIAWDVFGNNKTAVRLGYGIFYDRTLNGIWEQNAFADPPLLQTTTVNNNSASTLNLFDHPLAGSTGVPLGPNAVTATGNPTFKMPSYQDYNLSVQQQIASATIVEVAYVGTKGTHLLGDINLNQPRVANRLANPGVDVNALVPYLGYQGINSRSPIFMSNYNSLQVSLTRHFGSSLTAQAAYTYSKLLTDMPFDRGIGTPNTYNHAMFYGPSSLNTPQMFVASYVYDLPFYRNQEGLVGRALGGWELSGITTVQSGQSAYVTQGTDPWAAVCVDPTAATCTSLYPGGLGMTRSGSTAQILPDQVGDPKGPKTAKEYINIAAFRPAVGHFGNERAGAFLGPGFQLWDMSLIKNVRITERVKLQLRWETFNTFNHGSPSSIDTNLSNEQFDSSGNNIGTFGTVTGYHAPREMQLGAKISF
jgi:hypothetical protein